MDDLTKVDIIRTIIDDIDKELVDEEIIHLILEKTVSENTNIDNQEKATFGQRQADAFANFAGSWTFIIGFAVVLILWITVNIILVNKAFDPFPFILLNLVLSCLAAVQAPLIMMSQNRQEEKDRQRAENDYRVNLKTEIIIQDLHNKLDQLLENQERILAKQENNDI